ncbi:hypothetical protein NA78x_004362 [Anatilimnocola sp. NA78]|uniref:hypothetical protein n=1 Tax=Anatilimnocola sp. NA78 TaxID=3415683 RepID=UPI003CE4E9BD
MSLSVSLIVAVIAAVVILAFVIIALITLQEARRFQRKLAARTPRMRSSDSAFEAAFAVVAQAIGHDLGVDPAKLLPSCCQRITCGPIFSTGLTISAARTHYGTRFMSLRPRPMSAKNCFEIVSHCETWPKNCVEECY